METGKPGLASVPVHISSVSAQTEKRMDIQAPLTALYIHAVPALPAQPYSQPPAAAREPATLHLAMPQLYSKERLPILTLHIAGGLQSQPGLSLAAATPAARPKSAGKHVCPHCGRDCMKPSVLEKHLRCHTGERPYPCITCGVSFKTQSNLYKHKRTQAHARLSSETELSSLDSMSGSRETCISGLSLDEYSSIEDATQPAAEISCSASTANSVRTQSYVGDQKALTPPGQVHENAKVSPAGQKQMMDNEKPRANASRHLPLQRQEATLFSKQWETSVSRGKSQSHESTDSGFSESSDHYPSPGSGLPEHSMDSLTESVKEHLEETAGAQMSPGPCQDAQEPKHSARKQEQKTLEERISKLISENSAVVEDKQLENVRPRKTVLSKQGSIDLPMPYTYKDSFHFDMRISKKPNVGLQRSRRPDFYSSVPSQRSNTVEHAPLTRSNSLPFSVALLRPERSSPTSPYQSDYVTLAQRESSGHINPTGVAMKPVNQHLSTPRPLVRQTAVDGNHATDGLFLNSSVEEAAAGSLSCDGDGGDICGEPSSRKLRKKKAQKFAYNKWYMYGGGTFKKLYSEEKGGDDGVGKGRRGPVNSEHDVAQPKKLSAVHKETVTTMNFTSSSATACHPGCPPAKLKASQLHTSCSSLKTPLRRNLSLSVLPLSSIGSLVGHQTDRMSRVEAGRMVDEEKHADSTLQLCGTHVPSDRKKQKTDDKIMFPLEMGTDQNTPTRPLPSVAVTQQDTNLSCIQKNQKQTLLKGALFPRCIINANTPLVSRSPAVASAQSAAKANFLPKYQLKLPNAAEPDANASPQAVDKQTGTGGFTVNSVLSSPGAEQTSPSVTSEIKCGNSVTSRSTCGIKNTNALSSTRHQLSCTATTICQAETSGLNPDATSHRAAEHKHFAATTITTTCLQNDQAGLCSTSIQPSRSAELSAPVQLSRPVGPMVTHFPTALTTAKNQSSAAFSQCPPPPNPPLLHTQLSADLLSPYTSTTAPVIPCHIVPFDQMQPDAQNVFHVHTADLQICLQIISDEQLALIEPQIERQGGSVLSQRHDVGAAPLEVIQDAAQSSVAMESSNDGRGHQEQEFHQSESLSTFNTKRLQFDKPEPNLHLTEHSHSTQVTVSAESTPPVAPGSPLHPHKHSHVNKVNVTQSSTGEVMSTAASLKGAKSGRSQASAEEDGLSLSCCAEDGRPSQGGLISPTLSGQHKLSVAPLSPTTVNQSSTGGERPSKLKKQAAPCNEDTMRGTAEAYTSSRSESRETRPPQQVRLSTDEPSGSVSSFSINECKDSSQLNPHTTSNPVESALSEALDSSKHANMGGDRVGASEDSGPSQEITLSEDVITSSQSEKQHTQLTSVTSDIQVQRPKDVPAVLASYQSPTAGLVEGCAAQKELQTRGHGQPHSTVAGKTNLRCLEGRDGEDEKGRTETDEVPGQLDKAESNSTYTCSPDMKPEGEEGTARVDPFEQSWLSEQHLSQTHSGMSEYPPQIPQQAPSRSDNLNSSTGGSQTSLFISPPPPSDTNNLYISQQHWESSSIHNRQTEILCNTDSSQRLKAQLPDTQSAFSQAQSNSQMGTFLYQDQKQSSRQSAAPSAHPHQLSYSVQVSRAAAGSTSNHSILDNNAVLPSEPFTYPEPGGYQDDKDKAPNDYDKCQSFFLSGQIHGYQLAECLPGGIRPVPSCQDYTEDTSSSDDEGKLIIEL